MESDFCSRQPLQEPSQQKFELSIIPDQDDNATFRPSSESHTAPGDFQTSVASPPVEVIERKPTPPPVVEYATRNLVGLEKFGELSTTQKNKYMLFFHSRKSAKPARHIPELCPITGLAAKYRDPSTGIAYANRHAYGKLQELKRHEHTWSSMLGCYVGRAGIVARGVPDGFLG